MKEILRKTCLLILVLLIVALTGCKSEIVPDTIQKKLLEFSGKKFYATEFNGPNGSGGIRGSRNARLQCEIVGDSIEFSVSILEYDINGDLGDTFYIKNTPLYTFEQTEWTLYFYFKYTNTYLGKGWMVIRTDNESNVNQFSFGIYDPIYGGKFHYFMIADDSFKNNNIGR